MKKYAKERRANYRRKHEVKIRLGFISDFYSEENYIERRNQERRADVQAKIEKMKKREKDYQQWKRVGAISESFNLHHLSPSPPHLTDQPFGLWGELDHFLIKFDPP